MGHSPPTIILSIQLTGSKVQHGDHYQRGTYWNSLWIGHSRTEMHQTSVRRWYGTLNVGEDWANEVRYGTSPWSRPKCRIGAVLWKKDTAKVSDLRHFLCLWLCYTYWTPIFSSAVEHSASKGYNRALPKNGRYGGMGVSEYALANEQDGARRAKHTVLRHLSALSTTTRLHCPENPAETEEVSSEENQSSDQDPYKRAQNKQTMPSLK